MHKLVIQISGKQGSGKTTLTKNLTQALGVEVGYIKFADAIYDLHDTLKARAIELGVPVNPGRIYGGLLQYLGTEWGRNALGENVWVDAFTKKVKESEHRIILNDDTRFLNELHCLDYAGGNELDVVRIRLECDEKKRKNRAAKWRTDINHVSETGLDVYRSEFDLLLHTDKLNEQQVLDRVMDYLKTGELMPSSAGHEYPTQHQLNKGVRSEEL